MKPPLKHHFLRLGGAASAILLATSLSASAAVITWTDNGIVTDNTVLGLAGPAADIEYAVNFGGAVTTANGYVFSAYSAGNATITGATNPYTGYFPAGDSGDANFNTVLGTGYYGTTATVTLNGLLIGQKYSLLVINADTRTGGGDGRHFYLSDTDGGAASPFQQSNFANATGGNLGGYIFGTFTATAETQSFTERFQETSSGQMNALVVTAIPEPSAALLGGLGVLALLRRRRM